MSLFESIPVLKSGCFYFDLAPTTLALGVLGFLLSIAQFVADIVFFVYVWDDRTLRSLDNVVFFLDFSLEVFVMVLLVFLILGITHSNTSHIHIYLHGMFIVIMVYYFLALLMSIYFWKIGLVVLLFNLFSTYTWFCAHSLHQIWLKEPQIRHMSTIRGKQGVTDPDEVKNFSITEESGIENPLADSIP